jgi:hypothetical protein
LDRVVFPSADVACIEKFKIQWPNQI